MTLPSNSSEHTYIRMNEGISYRVFINDERAISEQSIPKATMQKLVDPNSRVRLRDLF